MELGLKDKVYVVTGGGSGIGAAVSRGLLDEGATVIAAGRKTAAVEGFAAEVAGRPCEVVEMELGDAEACRRLVEGAGERYGRLDGLVNNAGMNDGVGLETGTPERFVAGLMGNLVPAYTLAHWALALLKASTGTIVNVGSKVALTGQGGTSSYAAAKGGLLALTREWAVELVRYGIRVNCVVPAEVKTPAYTEWLASRPDPAAALRAIEERIPLGRRMTEPEEIAAMVLFLLSARQSGHTTGQVVVVDGGYTHLDRVL